MDYSSTLGAPTHRVPLDAPKVHHIPSWTDFGDPKRMDVITNIAKMRGHDPRIATLAVNIIKKAGVQPRDYRGQAAALLHFVQNEMYYVNEPGERLQDPLYTLKAGYGDCDDLSILLGALLTSIHLPWKLVISGLKNKKKKVRYHHGDRFPGGEKQGYKWSHIYVMVGDRPFTPKKWQYAETTIRGVPLGWDVVEGDMMIVNKGMQLKDRKAAQYAGEGEQPPAAAPAVPFYNKDIYGYEAWKVALAGYAAWWLYENKIR